jgi:hypothetical protein
MREAWDDRFQIIRPDFLQRYIEGAFDVHAHIRIHAIDLEAVELCAVFGQPYAGDDLRRRLDSEISGHPNLSWEAKHDVDDRGQPVLIGVVELVQDEQRVVSRLSAPVRLHLLDDCLRPGGEALYYSVLHSLFVTSGNLTNRESDLVPRGSAMAMTGQRPDEVIKTRAQLIQHLSCHDPERMGRGIGAIIENGYDIFERLRIAVSYSSVAATLAIKESWQLRCDVTDVLVCPLNLR